VNSIIILNLTNLQQAKGIRQVISSHLRLVLQKEIFFNVMRSLFVFLLFVSCQTFGQQIFPTVSKTGTDTIKEYQVQLNEVVVVDSRIFANDTLRYEYNQTKHYVKMILPYVDAAVKMFNEIDIATIDMSRREKKKYIKTREQEIKEKFEDRLKNLNITQGRLLVKILNRQLSISCHDIVKELKNPITAAYYQSWARLNGIKLNENYKPENNRDLERILRSLGY
jgi:hypothetical protein